MKILIQILLLILICLPAFAESFELDTTSQIGRLQQLRNCPKLYAQNFILINTEAEFKVVTNPETQVYFTADFGSGTDKISMNTKSNDKGVAVFKITVPNSTDLVGKSVAVDAYIIENNQKVKAVMQSETSRPKTSNRVYITDNASAKGVYFSPSQSINKVMSSLDYNENSNFDPLTNQMYDYDTPAYIKNMRDAQDNVREIPQHTNNSNR